MPPLRNDAVEDYLKKLASSDQNLAAIASTADLAAAFYFRLRENQMDAKSALDLTRVLVQAVFAQKAN